jgi:hypothetical protein
VVPPEGFGVRGFLSGSRGATSLEKSRPLPVEILEQPALEPPATPFSDLGAPMERSAAASNWNGS